MASTFVAILVALALTHYVPDLQRLRRFGWLARWQETLGAPSNAGLGLLLVVGLPVLACLLVQGLLRGQWFGLPGFAFAIAVLFYCLGPRDLERDVQAVEKAPDSGSRLQAAQALHDDETAEPLVWSAQALVEAAFLAALRRAFGAIFWFVLFGASGALVYRLVQQLAHAREAAPSSPPAQQALTERVALVLDWAPAHLIALALAIASDFDAVFKTWRDYRLAHGKGWFCLDLGFLGAIARASVCADIADGEDHPGETASPSTALFDAMALIRRVLIVWLALLAVLVVGDWFS